MNILRRYWLLFLFIASNSFFFLYFLFTNAYPWIFVLLHYGSCVCLLLWLVQGFYSDKFIQRYKKEILFIVVLFIVGFAIRMYRIDVITPGMWGDEVGYGIIGETIINNGSFVPFTYDRFAPPSPYMYLIGWTVNTFGRSIVTLRFWSVFFGALAIPLMYVFLRKVFNSKAGVIGSILFIILYHHVIISRFSYEISLGIVFQMLVLLSLYTAWKKRKFKNYLLVICSLTLVLYTYVAFRTFALFSFILLLIIMTRDSISLTKRIVHIFSIVMFFCLFLGPWLTFSLRHPDHVFARVQAVSIFHQNLSSHELIKELSANTALSLGVFGLTGDPNLRQNPGKTTMYDPIVIMFFLLGIVWLFRKNKPLLFAGIVLMIPSFVNDILSTEFIPEFHYYGIGHPNTLRVVGLIPIVLSFSVAGFLMIDQFFKQKNISYIMRVFLIGLCISLSLCINWTKYFGQQPNQYIYEANGVRFIDIVTFANKAYEKGVKTLGISESLVTDKRITYFINKDLVIIPVKNTVTVEQLPRDTITLLNVRTNEQLAKQLTTVEFQKQHRLDIRMIPTQFNLVDTFIISPY